MVRGLRWGILGAGRIAAQFAEGLRASVEAGRVTAVWSRTPGKAEALAAAHGARAHAALAALLGDAAVDAVYVATPNALHREHCLAALDAGKPVLCEKPFALSAAEAREVIERARARRVFCMEAMWMRFAPAVREAEALVQRGALGAPRAVHASLGFRFAADPARALFVPAMGGGALLDMGVYPLALAVAVLGRAEVVEGVATLGPTGVDEHASAVLRHRGGAQSLVSASLACQLANEAVIVGEEGVLRLHAPLYCPEVLTRTATFTIRQGDGGSGRRQRLLRHPALGWARRLAARRNDRTWTRPAGAQGMVHEAVEVARCLAAGKTESEVQRLDQTLAVMEIVDGIRAAWGAPGAREGRAG